MEKLVDYLQADKKSGVLSYRRKYPKDLSPYIKGASPSGRGRVEMKVSLRAISINEAGAVERYAAAERAYLAVVAKARKVASGTVDRLDVPLIQFLAGTYVHNQLALDEAGRWGRPGPTFSYASRPAPEEDYRECRQLLEAYDSAGLVQFWRPWVLSYADALGYVIGEADPEFPTLCQAMGEAACELWLALDKRIDEKAAETPPAAQRPGSRTVSTPTGSTASLQSVADELMASKVDPVGHSTVSQWRSTLRFFREAHGLPEVGKVNRQMVTEWLELLVQRPAKVPTSERKLPLRDLVARYAGRNDVPLLTNKTLRGHLAALATIWNKAQERGLIDEALANPFKARKSLASAAQDEEGAEFDMEELQAILELPVFTAGERPKHGRGEASYWMPLILLWTGMRPEEAAQLLVSDFYDHEDTGELMVEVTDEGEHPAKGPRKLKSSRRAFPVPSKLLNLGLADYLQHLKDHGEAALFPRLVVKASTKGYLAPSIGEWWSKYLREQGLVLKAKNGKARRPMRDFRTSWATAARQARVPEEAMSYLMGHSNKGAVTTRRYGSKHPHASWMSEVAFPKLDFARVRHWTA